MPANLSVRYSTMSRHSTMLNRPQQAPLGPRTSANMGRFRNRASRMPSEGFPAVTSPPPSTSTSPNSSMPNLYLPEFGHRTTMLPETVEEIDSPMTPAYDPKRDSALSSSQSQLSFASSVNDTTPVTPDTPLLAAQEGRPRDDPPEPLPEPLSQDDAVVSLPAPPTRPPPPPPVAVTEVNDASTQVLEGIAEEAEGAEGSRALPEAMGKRMEQVREKEEEEVASPAYHSDPQDESTPSTTPEGPTPAVTQTPNSVALSLPPAPSPAPSRAASATAAKSAGPPPKLTPPPKVKFDVEPVQWKGLTLDAALWTFDSKELQAIVSRAIRSSALESFIRLLTLENLDTTLPDELKRLESAKTMTQAKYRFLDDDGMHASTKLVVQLSETVAECDLVMEELVKLTDQITQVKKLVDHHWASALAIALRKLNGSFGRRSADLKAARERIDEMEAGLSDDELDDAIIETAEKVSVSLARATSPSSPGSDTVPLSTVLLANAISDSDVNGSSSRMHPSQLSPLATSPTTSKSNGSKENHSPMDIPDSVSIRSVKSTKSAKSSRSIGREGHSRTATVSAARTRSYRASQSSLRLPSAEAEEQLPPVPNLPTQFSAPIGAMHSAKPSSTLLHYEGSVEGSQYASYHMRRSSLDSMIGTYGHRTPTPWTGNPAAMDDMYVGSSKRESRGTLGRSHIHDGEIQLVPRTPPPVPPKVIPLEQHEARPRKWHSARRGIPSIWMNADAPKTPSERVDSLMRGNSKGKAAYQRLRTLTKRYSLPFPIFASKSSGSSSALSSPESDRRPASHT
ncbi:hypothetical protein FA13DRAFT_1726961 [Coprinellus micaceus]|uniref:Uncharacterized protein n=1 Tax=Coprinellus micaceus TaxID=71717 RepID=A0A4Y7TR08_COPMI|nr:hypothetical protein FA13DRAFT_1726961 [Coprinellus micaceus]